MYHSVTKWFAVLACWCCPMFAQAQSQPCNGSIYWPTIREGPEETRTCPGLGRSVGYGANGSAQCNQIGFNGPVRQGYASAFISATGTCTPVYCDYVYETVGSILRADGKGMTVWGDWFNGIWNSGTSTCGQDYKLDESSDDRVDFCNGATCCEGADSCTQRGDRWFPENCSCVPSPLFLLFEGRWEDALTSARDGVPFLLRPGVQPGLVAWSRRGTTGVGLLARDRNGNGMIDDGSELYGSATPQLATAGLRHGFTALATEDYDGNGWVDSNDPAYSEITVWFDRNHNGVSEAGELVSLKAVGVKAISTHYTALEQDDRHGNRFAFEGEMVLFSQGRARVGRVYDVYPTIAPIARSSTPTIQERN